MNTYIPTNRAMLLFGLQQIVDEALNPTTDLLTLHSEGCVIGEKAPLYTSSGPAPSQELPLMQRIWDGAAQVSHINLSNREEDLDDKSSAEALRIIRLRFGDEILPFSDEKFEAFQNRINLEAAIQLEADRAQIEASINNESTFSIPDFESGSLNMKDRLLEIRREQDSVMQQYHEVLQRSEQDMLLLDKHQSELQELHVEVELTQSLAQELNEDLKTINQKVDEIILTDEAIQEQIGDVRRVASQIELEQVDLSNELHALTEELIVIEERYESIKRQEPLEYPHHHVISNLENALTEISTNVNTQIQETLHNVSETLPSFQGLQETISTFQGQVKELPFLIKDTIMGTIKESFREAAAFLWENFTNLGWNTIEVISNIGKTILQYPLAACSYILRNVSAVSDRINLPLAVLGILSGCAFLMTGTPFTFGVTAVVGYLFIKGMF
ncbi:putative membrane protein (plasmid) [Candidatus Protochlamydia naegleriophila]|uniref:Putative membrane protein n=1 Tax=Candidatus Protochlamydia naegleriophila TaxID=389348 RepID=A0A0U5JDY6_9BACT|nr:hypothetical protein [Candidatus Protochlamydia naegleriophila]CUI18185.1 putative membrane protein [Candidatus Protochlamydia naegleriophila]